MSATTGIQWTDKTWNPWHGCRKVSPGCDNCYMFREKKQYGQDPTEVVRSKTTFRAPLKWREPARVFTCSWSDWFIRAADPWRSEAWDIIRQTPHLTYQILTKRAELIRDRVPDDWPLPNVWLGVSVENQKLADSRIPTLLGTPAVIRFLSVEPLLGPIRLAGALSTGLIQWVIVGGESGPGARPCDLAWIRSVVEQCKAAGVSVFVKQLGAVVVDNGIQPAGGWWPESTQRRRYVIRKDGSEGWRSYLRDRKGGDPSEWPDDLRVREFPK